MSMRRKPHHTTTALQFFGYRYPPFSDTFELPEPFESPTDTLVCERALALIRQGKSLAIYGEAGTGKSMLAKSIADQLDPKQYRVAMLPYGGLKRTAILRDLCDELDLDTTGRKNMLSKLALDFRSTNNKPFPVIIVDDAHEMENQSYLDLCSLMHEAQSRRVNASLLLVGQPALKRKLELDIFAPVRTRLTCMLAVGTLDHEESKAFVQFRLQIANAEPGLFDPSALECLAVDSKGNRRVLMNVGALCLEEAARRKDKLVTAEIVNSVTTELLQ